MSGPKYGEYELMIRERLRIEEENRRAILKKKEERKSLYEREKSGQLNKMLNDKITKLQKSIEKNSNTVLKNFTYSEEKNVEIDLKRETTDNRTVKEELKNTKNKKVYEEYNKEKELAEEQLIYEEENIEQDSIIKSIYSKEIQGFKSRLDLIENQDDIKIKLQEINRLIEQINLLQTEISTNREYILDKYEEYMVYIEECSENNVKTFKSIKELETEIEKLKNKYNKLAEEEYIEKSVNEVMQELGYDIILSETLENIEIDSEDKMGNVYSFEDETGIQVFTSDSGTIMLEVVNISDNTVEITESDRELAVNKMKSFCDKYPLIIEMLKDKGINVENIECKPIDEKFTKKIVIPNADKKEKNINNWEKRRKVKYGK